jgi:hypothetical protein
MYGAPEDDTDFADDMPFEDDEDNPFFMRYLSIMSGLRVTSRLRRDEPVSKWTGACFGTRRN